MLAPRESPEAWPFTTRGHDRIGIWALTVFFLGVLAAGYLGPPPPSAGAVVGGTAILGLPLWGADVVDRHRSVQF